MSLDTYAGLKAAVASWVHRSDLTSYVDDLITLGEARINREVRAKEMETAFSSNMSGGVIAAPTGYLELKHAYIDGSPTTPLKTASADSIFRKYPTRSADCRPAVIGYDAGNFVFGPYPDADYTVKGTYFKKQGPLSSAVYDLFSNNPDLFLFAALAEARAFIQDDKRVPIWEAKYKESRDSVNAQRQSASSGGGLSMGLP